MPQRHDKTRPRKRPASGYTDEHRQALLTGHDYARLFRGPREWQRAWTALRDELLPAWIADHPGTRPATWWRFDAPERRRRTNGIHPFDNAERQRHIEQYIPEGSPSREAAMDLFYGTPRMMIVPDDFAAKYETGSQYLRRLGLLTAGEHEALGRIEADPLGYYLARCRDTADEARALAAYEREQHEPTRTLDADGLRERALVLCGERGGYETKPGKRLGALLHIHASYRHGDKSVAAAAQLFDGVLPEAIVALWKGGA